MRISDWSSDVCSSDLDAIMGSMTPKERAKPEILTAKRKIRIANGSGTTVQQVNKVLKMHQEMAGAMKKIRKMGGLKGLGALFGKGGGIPGIDRKSTRLNSSH